MGNPEPLLAWTDVVIISVRKVGKKGNWHLKFTVNYDGVVFDAMRWSKWAMLTDFTVGQTWTMIGKCRVDGHQWYVVVEDLVNEL
jgi:single-stranded DNA-specific DHH superfamily exonuclease